MTINGSDFKVVRYKVNGDYMTFLQSFYFVDSKGFFIGILLNHEFEKPNASLYAILESFELKKDWDIDQLLETQNEKIRRRLEKRPGP